MTKKIARGENDKKNRDKKNQKFLIGGFLNFRGGPYAYVCACMFLFEAVRALRIRIQQDLVLCVPSVSFSAPPPSCTTRDLFQLEMPLAVRVPLQTAIASFTLFLVSQQVMGG